MQSFLKTPHPNFFIKNLKQKLISQGYVQKPPISTLEPKDYSILDRKTCPIKLASKTTDLSYCAVWKNSNHEIYWAVFNKKGLALAFKGLDFKSIPAIPLETHFICTIL